MKITHDIDERLWKALNHVCGYAKEGKGITASDCQFLWQEDEHSDKWIVQPLVATDKELAVMRGISLPYATQWETGRGDEQC